MKFELQRTFCCNPPLCMFLLLAVTSPDLLLPAGICSPHQDFLFSWIIDFSLCDSSLAFFAFWSNILAFLWQHFFVAGRKKNTHTHSAEIAKFSDKRQPITQSETFDSQRGARPFFQMGGTQADRLSYYVL